MAALPDLLSSSLAQKTDAWSARARASLLGQLPCRAGCSQCCIGPFPITVLDVDRLRIGLRSLSDEQRERIEQVAQEQVVAMEAAYPMLVQSRYLDQWHDAEIDRLVTEFHQQPCPALGTQGLCEVYEHRPLACRSMGVPAEQDGITHGACEVQTFVPIVRLSIELRAEEDELARQESEALALRTAAVGAKGEELLSPYGFLVCNKPKG